MPLGQWDDPLLDIRDVGLPNDAARWPGSPAPHKWLPARASVSPGFCVFVNLAQTVVPVLPARLSDLFWKQDVARPRSRSGLMPPGLQLIGQARRMQRARVARKRCVARS